MTNMNKSINKKTTFGIHIFTRDLRINDNNAFNYCIENSDCVLPIFVFTPEQIQNNKYLSHNSLQFLFECLYDLDSKIHNNLAIFEGQHHKFLKNIIEIINTKLPRFENILITIAKDYTPYSTKRFNTLKSLISLNKQKKINIIVEEIEDYTLFKLGDIVSASSNTAYSVFSPFYKQVLSRIDEISKPKQVKSRISFCKLPSLQSNFSLDVLNKKYINPQKLAPERFLFGGRTIALKKLTKTFISKFKKYGVERNDLTKETTQYSPYIKFGCISIREVFHSLLKHLSNKNDELIRQLIWREFYAQLYYAYPRLLKGKSLKEKYDNIRWNNNAKWFNLWKEGKTGFPIVDACMRQLNNTGYMHNRGRMICASFLVKILLIDWKKGEKYFAQKLVDYDPVSNNGGWTWVASNGADSQPYFRIMNPWLQAEKHDPNVEYIHKWLPELRELKPKDIHKWEINCSSDEFKHINYNCPMVNYKEQRNKALLLYKSIM